jgi:hypothetical protein
MKQYLLLEMVGYLLKNILKIQDISNTKFLVTNLEIMFTYLKENAQFKEETRKLLKKHLLQQWIKKQDIKWEHKP